MTGYLKRPGGAVWRLKPTKRPEPAPKRERKEGGMKAFFIKLWVAYLAPYIWNWVPAMFERLVWLRHRKAGVKELATLRALAPDVHAIAGCLKAQGYRWVSDPWGGKFDYETPAWVMCVRRKGDCDDFANLWQKVLKGHGHSWRIFTCKTKGGYQAHAMTAFAQKGELACHLLSNTDIATTVPLYDRKELLTTFYDGDTDVSFFWRHRQ